MKKLVKCEKNKSGVWFACWTGGILLECRALVITKMRWFLKFCVLVMRLHKKHSAY